MNYFENIAAEEDIEEAVEKIEKILGKSGRMLTATKNTFLNATLRPKKYGPIWYGDLNMLEDNVKLEKVAEVLGMTLQDLVDNSLNPESMFGT